MNWWVYIKDGVVVDVARVDPFTIFNPEYAKLFIASPENVHAGWIYDGTNFTEPPKPPEQPLSPPTAPTTPTKEDLIAELAALTAKINSLP